ncbi:MAG: hypothetical protein HRT72_05330 [Flavobacteriales bacterium]|nr:hypothetical protein [Flavobacteriales bacterium]
MKTGLIISLLFFLSSCGPASLITQFNGYSDTELNLPIYIEGIIYKDARKKVDQSVIELPSVFASNQVIKHNPILIPFHQNEMSRVIRSHCKGGKDTASVLIIITDSYQEFSATWWQQTEKAHVELDMIFQLKNKYNYSANSKAEYYISSGNAKPKRSETLYRIALKNGVHKALEMIHKSYIIGESINK